ncbi:MAG: hypothetical protein WA639_19510 [Candidatus Acidiferrum sp.]
MDPATSETPVGIEAAAERKERAAAGTITIRRKSPDDAQQRQIIVKLDGEKVGELFYGDTISVQASAGHHKLQVDNTWNWKTVELDVAAGEHLKFQAVSKAGRLTWFLVSLFGAGPIYVSIKREE